MSTRRRQAWWPAIVLTGLAASASAPAAAQTLPAHHYAASEGLAHDTLGRITVDSLGFVWFATVAGATRFDGRGVVTYTMAEGLPDPVVNHVYEDRHAATGSPPTAAASRGFGS
jgi:hypothetical protein